jgi:hypothetical protein
MGISVSLYNRLVILAAVHYMYYKLASGPCTTSSVLDQAYVRGPDHMYKSVLYDSNDGTLHTVWSS